MKKHPKMKDVAYVNEYIARRQKTSVRCEVRPGKGRVLVATRAVLPGDIVFSEEPLLQVAADEDDPLYQALDRWVTHPNYDYTTMWYWCAVNSLLSEEDRDYVADFVDSENCTEGQEELIALCNRFLEIPLRVLPEQTLSLFRMFFHPHYETPSLQALSLSDRLIRHFDCDIETVDVDLDLVDPRIVRILRETFAPKSIDSALQIWVLNCFEGDWEPLTYNTFYLPTFSSHSCLPNTVWHINEEGDFVMVARMSIEAGEEISLSYLSDDDLILPTVRRRAELMDTKQFLCRCIRCDALADLSRGFSCLSCPQGVFFLNHTAASTERVPLAKSKGVHSQLTALEGLAPALQTLEPYKVDWSTGEVTEFERLLRSSKVQQWYRKIPANTCLKCGAKADPADIKQLTQFDESLWAAYSGDDESLQSVCANLRSQHGKRLRCHYYLVRVCDTVVKELNQQDFDNILNVLQIKIELCRRLYPMPFGMLAWTQRELVETRMLRWGLGDKPISGEQAIDISQDRLFAEMLYCADVKQNPLAAANELLTTFKLLFTEKHEFFVSNSEYLCGLLDNLRRIIDLRREDDNNEIPRDWLQVMEKVHGVAACR